MKMPRQIKNAIDQQLSEEIDFEMLNLLRRERKRRGFRTLNDCLHWVLAGELVKLFEERGKPKEAAKCKLWVDKYAPPRQRGSEN
jgi:hypothetical protein